MALNKLKRVGLDLIRKPLGLEYECNGCGFKWGIKRENPPTKCPRCRSLNTISVW